MALPFVSIDGRYELQLHLGDGIYAGRRQFRLGDDGPAVSGEDHGVMIKLERCDAEKQSLERETENICSLAGGVGVPLVERQGSQGGYRYMVHRRAGPTLEALLGWCRAFSLKTVLLLAEQLLRLLRFIHSRSLTLRQVRPSAFAIGAAKAGNQITLVEAAEARAIRDGDAGADLAALGYMLIYMCRRVAPWRGLEVSPIESQYDDILQHMIATPTETLCEGLPREFIEYMEYVRRPIESDKPDYDHLCQLFRTAFTEKGFSRDGVYDWIVYKYRYNSGQDPAQPVTGITDQLGGRHISDEEFGKEFSTLVEELGQAKGLCLSLSNTEERDRKPDYWTEVTTAHSTLVQWCYDIMMFSRHPETPDDLRRQSEDLRLHDEVWDAGIKPCLMLLRAGVPQTSDYIQGFLYPTFILLTAIAECAPQRDEKWEGYIRDLSAYGMKYDSCGPWTRVHKCWGGSV
ncbi:uncharacterized protein GIQ15_01886 [Arthroderma uncinatum]|uniref:uncharacterized protein n=1 Tax=Arthroderma uncinatum TaxID=74035 RepID=UPI00144ACF20|nr:uncharacterized protein GIQ15_01886 [Arthroderma uncinatum]KAF3492369.1 hypothetical protein GIQ15_01886 [Arthroderma uncinatum]